MDYSRIIKRAFEIAWKYKSLWIFGMFASSGVLSLNWRLSGADLGITPEAGWPFIHINDAVVQSLLLAIIVFGLVMTVMALLADAALIDAVNRTERGGTYRFSYSFSTAVDVFLKFFGLTLLVAFAAMAFFGIMFLLGLLAFWIHLIIGIVFVVIAIPTIVAFMFILYWVVQMSKRSMVIRRASIGDAIEEGFYLVKRHVSTMVVWVLILIGLTIAFSIVLGIVWVIANLPIGTVILTLGYGLVPALLAGIVMGLPISIVAGGITGTFFSAIITKFYIELVEPSAQAAPAPPVAPGPLA